MNNQQTLNRKKINMLVGTAVLAAIVIVLQTLASNIRVGPFTITLSLIPIIIGAVLYGPASGAILGGVFGLVVVIAVLLGADTGGALMMQINPFATVAICLLKSTIAGFLAGLVANKLANRGRLKLGVTLASILAPVCNTGLFILGTSVFFHDLLKKWAGGQSVVLYIFAGMVGFNFLVELLVGLILVPVILQIIKAVKRRR